MPELTGREPLGAALAIRHALPTILSSGFGEADVLASAEAMGVRAFLRKPSTIREIVAAVDGLLSNLPEE